MIITRKPNSLTGLRRYDAYVIIAGMRYNEWHTKILAFTYFFTLEYIPTGTLRCTPLYTIVSINGFRNHLTVARTI